MGVHRSSPGADFTAGNNPVERTPRRPLNRDRPSATVDAVMGATKGIEIAVANRHRLGPHPIEQGLEADPSYRGRGLE